MLKNAARRFAVSANAMDFSMIFFTRGSSVFWNFVRSKRVYASIDLGSVQREGVVGCCSWSKEETRETRIKNSATPCWFERCPLDEAATAERS